MVAGVLAPIWHRDICSYCDDVAGRQISELPNMMFNTLWSRQISPRPHGEGLWKTMAINLPGLYLVS